MVFRNDNRSLNATEKNDDIWTWDYLFKKRRRRNERRLEDTDLSEEEDAKQFPN